MHNYTNKQLLFIFSIILYLYQSSIPAICVPMTTIHEPRLFLVAPTQGLRNFSIKCTGHEIWIKIALRYVARGSMRILDFNCKTTFHHILVINVYFLSTAFINQSTIFTIHMDMHEKLAIIFIKANCSQYCSKGSSASGTFKSLWVLSYLPIVSIELVEISNMQSVFSGNCVPAPFPL